MGRPLLAPWWRVWVFFVAPRDVGEVGELLKFRRSTYQKQDKN